MIRIHSRLPERTGRAADSGQERSVQVQTGLVRSKLMRESLLMLVDLGLTPHEMSRYTGLPLATIRRQLRSLIRPTPVALPQDPASAPADARQMEADHRIANSIQFAASMLRHESRRATSVQAAQAALTDAAARLNAVARLHRQMAKTASGGDVSLAAFLGPFCKDIAQSVGAVIEVRAPGVTLGADVAGQICIIVNELAMNAVKHGRPVNGAAVTLTLEAVKSGRGQLTILLRDNGCGLAEDFSLKRSTGLGMVIVTSTVEKLSGSIRTLRGDGAAFEIILPCGTEATASIKDHCHDQV